MLVLMVVLINSEQKRNEMNNQIYYFPPVAVTIF